MESVFFLVGHQFGNYFIACLITRTLDTGPNEEIDGGAPEARRRSGGHNARKPTTLDVCFKETESLRLREHYGLSGR